jgi:secondary thiamine-phosphate synthase enzyme
MQNLSLVTETIHIDLGMGPDIVDITERLESLIRKSEIGKGDLSATVVGSTGSITTIEFEPGAVADLKDAIARLAPPGMHYAHELAWHDGNGHSHVQAAMMGPSVSLPIRNGRLALGTWQQVVVINHDNKPRPRRPLAVTMIGA